MGGIFISYRRSDSQGEAGRLFDDLVKHFGEHAVFMDVAAIEAGRDFRRAIEEGVTKCGVLLVMIGLEWLEAKDERGKRRLDDASDFVRIETAAALKRDIPVIPVLVRGARMPSAEQLPEELKDLAYRNCIELTHARWRSDIQLLLEALRRQLVDTSPVGTSARASEATASATTGSLQEEVTASSKPEDKDFARIDPAALQRITRELAFRIGPIASIVVKRAAPHCDSLEELYLKVAEEIDSREEREKFLQERAAPPPRPLRGVAEVTTPADHMSRTAGLPPPSGGNDLASETAQPATRAHSPNRWKYLLLASGGGVLILVLVFVARFALSGGAGSPQTAQSLPQATHVAEPAPVKTGAPERPAETPAEENKSAPSPATGAAGESERTSPKRVHVPTEESMRLLVKRVEPVYPIVAREAHVQGTVVLDAEIAKDGTVETLKVISGHPLLIGAALDAAKQWRYKPYMQNGKPVAIETQIIIGFTIKVG